MGCEWRELSLAELADTNPPRVIKKGEEKPFIDMASLPTHGRDVDKKGIITRIFNGSGSRFKDGDTLIARITPCLENGKTVLVSGLGDDVVGHGSTEFIVIASKNGKADSGFLYYLARSPFFREYAIQHMEGTSGRQRVPNVAVANFSFLCPPPEERQQIASILSSLDDRIALLRETNATLEAIAQAIFKSWFVDFDPVKAKAEGREPEGMDTETAALFPSEFEESDLGLIPKGWAKKRLEDILELVYGKALKATDRIGGDVPVYGSGGVTGYHNKSLVDGPSIIVGRKGTVGSLYWEDRPFFPIDTVFYVIPKISLSFCYYLLQTLGLDNMNTDAAVPGLNRNNAYRLLFSCPDEAVLVAFSQITNILRRKIHTNLNNIQTLSSLRDTLLPRLMSGKLRAPEAKMMIEEANP